MGLPRYRNILVPMTCCVLGPLLIFFFYLYGSQSTMASSWGVGLRRFSISGQDRGAATPNTTLEPVPVNPLPPDHALKNMSHKDLQALYHSYVMAPQITCSSVIRMGSVKDGGWEFCDDPLYTPSKDDCLVYSYGINYDFTFDDSMAKYGCEVHSFDPSMAQSPHRRGTSVFFHTSGIGSSDILVRNPKGKGKPWQLHTLATHRKMLHHVPSQRQLDILKMDVEGAELSSLSQALDDGSLDDVRQLIFELHVSMKKEDPSRETYIQFLGLLKRLYERGFRIYMTHRNHEWSAFVSKLDPDRQLVGCHELQTVNINNKNLLDGQGRIRVRSTVKTNASSTVNKQERLMEQMNLLEEMKNS